MFCARCGFICKPTEQLDTFVSWFPEVGAHRNDAFSFSWHEFSPYIFCPFNLMGKVVMKIVTDKLQKALLIIPHWRSQFPTIVSNLIPLPIRLPCHRDLLTLPHNNQVHPLAKKMRMVAVVLSGDSLKVAEFQSSFWNHHQFMEGRNKETVCLCLGQVVYLVFTQTFQSLWYNSSGSYILLKFPSSRG